MTTPQEMFQVCKQCKSFCCTLVLPPVTEEERNIILNAGYHDYFIKIDKGVYKIESGNQKKCPYLTNDYHCQIHTIKPTLCRIWPVIPHNKNKKRGCIIVKCPLFDQLSYKMINQAKKQAKNIPNEVVDHLWNIIPEIKNKYKIFEYEKI